jgi:hypothetical protein
MKIVCKALTSRLQAQIGGLIDPDQSGFITGRSISENFVYATEVIQCCHKRRAPAFALKLDFAKAFDSINWDSLREVLRVRGFPEKWCGWIQAIFDSSRSAVVLNGIPGRWISCRRGLRQGDPLSPYLFLLVADVLQRMIQQDGVLEHPLCDGMPPVVLQYADDTLVLFHADAAAARRLKNVLDRFAAATGLVINFHKSTLVSMHVDSVMVDEVRGVLGCTLESFPQNYLGLPLSCEKLPAAAFAPLIAKADRYLSGWRAVLLSAGGRIVLINAVLDALPTYAMAALPLHPKVVKKLDALRRAFLWAATERVSGAQCLVAWDAVCRPKAKGGLGIWALAEQNRCLLIKLLHRLHAATTTRGLIGSGAWWEIGPSPCWQGGTCWGNTGRRSAPSFPSTSPSPKSS